MIVTRPPVSELKTKEKRKRASRPKPSRQHNSQLPPSKRDKNQFGTGYLWSGALNPGVASSVNPGRAGTISNVKNRVRFSLRYFFLAARSESSPKELNCGIRVYVLD